MMKFYSRLKRTMLFTIGMVAMSSGSIFAEEKSIILQEAGTIKELISPEEMYNITELTVAGPINGTDIQFIRDMLGRGVYGSPTDGKVEILNLSNARIVEGGDSYVYSSNFTEDNIIGPSMFDFCENLKHIYLPNNVTEIRNGAFYRCSSLEDIEIPETVTSIYSNAFFYAESLKTFNIPKNVNFIEDAVFCGCTNMTSFTVDSENTHFSSVDGVLCNKEGNILISFPCGITGEYALPDGFTEIAPAAFNESLIQSVTLPEGIIKIGDAAFSNSYSLESIWLPNSLKSIEFDTFYWCEKLKEIHFPDQLESIGARAFVRCGSLTSIKLPESVKVIEDRVFANCENLESIVLSSSLESFGVDVFISDKKLSAITVPAENAHFTDVDGVLFNKKRTFLIKCPEGKAGAYVLPSEVEIVDEEAFYNCAELTSVSMEDNVQSIGLSAFSGCSAIEDIQLSNNLLKIPGYLFESCTMLSKVNIGNNVTEIEEYAFSGCTHLESITMPPSLTTIGSDAFSYCSSLAEITAEGEVPPVCSKYSFYGLNTSNIKLNVPAKATEAYLADDIWNKFNIIGVSGITDPSTSHVCFINVFTINGTSVLENASLSDLDSLPKGIYIVKENKTEKAYKIIK